MDLDTFIKFYKELPGDKLVYPNSFDDFLSIMFNYVEDMDKKLKKKYNLLDDDEVEKFHDMCLELYENINWENFIFVPDWHDERFIKDYDTNECTVQFVDEGADTVIPVYAYIYHSNKGYDRMVLDSTYIVPGQGIDSDLDYINATYVKRKPKFLNSLKERVERQYFQAVFNSPNHGLKEGVKL